MRIALAQINTTIGDLQGNTAKILHHYQQAQKANAHLLITPELALTGYPPRDLLLNPHHIQQQLNHLNHITTQTKQTALLIGCATPNPNPGKPLHNTIALLHQGKQITTRHKTLLPNYDIFDEDRYFQPAQNNQPIQFQNHKLALTICEDTQHQTNPHNQQPIHQTNPIQTLLQTPCHLLINIAASPWHIHKPQQRLKNLQHIAKKHHTPIAYCNLTGANDELIFDGNSLILNQHGSLLAQAPPFTQHLLITNLNQTHTIQPNNPPTQQQIHQALTLGIRDYFHKTNHKTAIIGLSGGIDSALTATLATHALGPKNILAISLPTQHSTPHSITDAQQLAKNLNIQHHTIPIHNLHQTTLQTLQPTLKTPPNDITNQNIQARLRALILMSLANQHNALLLNTGNKSELAVGYTTLYGDMCGALAILSDLTKTQTYQLANWINQQKPTIPQNTLQKPPSAELKPNQQDTDTLPPYHTLDTILNQHLLHNKTTQQIHQQHNIPTKTIQHTLQLIQQNEHKRHQTPPGLKITTKAFGTGRRIPIAAKPQPNP